MSEPSLKSNYECNNCILITSQQMPTTGLFIECFGRIFIVKVLLCSYIVKLWMIYFCISATLSSQIKKYIYKYITIIFLNQFI